MSKNDCILSCGVNSWLDLPNALLSPKGKMLVTEDPNLSPETIEALKAIEPTSPDRFGVYYFSDQSNMCDIGLATLSMCIKENPSATMAELVARYADLRNIPYAHVAVVLSEMRNGPGFLRYIRGSDSTYRAVPWAPTEVPRTSSMLPPPKKHKAM